MKRKPGLQPLRRPWLEVLARAAQGSDAVDAEVALLISPLTPRNRVPATLGSEHGEGIDLAAGDLVPGRRVVLDLDPLARIGSGLDAVEKPRARQVDLEAVDVATEGPGQLAQSGRQRARGVSPGRLQD